MTYTRHRCSAHVKTNPHVVVSFSLQRLCHPLVSACLFPPAAPGSGCCRRPAMKLTVSKTGRKLSSLRLRLVVPHLLAIHGAYRARHVVGCGISGGGTTAPGHGSQVHVAVGAVHPGTGLRSELRLLRVDAVDGEQRKGAPRNEGDTWLAHSCSRDSQSTLKLQAKVQFFFQ